MRKSVHIVILCLTLLLNARCSRTADEEGIAPDSSILVNLDINVALSDIASATRAVTEEDKAAANDREKMSTLRIIIVRKSTGEVEANRFIELDPTMEHGIERFKVVANDTKLVYLFVNELSRIDDAGGTKRKLVDYDLAKIFPRQKFPTEDLEALTIQLNGNTQQLAGCDLPMSDCHEIEVGGGDKKGEDGIMIQEEKLFVTRAAVKFSFRITNNTLRPITLDDIELDKMARAEYYLPNNAVRNDKNEIIDYEVPNNEYYTFKRHCGTELPVGKEVQLDNLIYLLEGKYTDPANNEKNYSIALNTTVYGKYKQFKDDFPNLNNLPRNTHVVVNITIADDIAWIVDVVPYGSITLEPEFGI